MREEFVRTSMLFGKEAIETLAGKKIAVFGVGGVGGYVTEALARSGIGSFILIDNDTVSKSNINRQIVALQSTIGLPKVEVMKTRIKDINPDANVDVRQMFYLPENANEIDLAAFDYVIDCIDTVSAKIELACRCRDMGVPMIVSMGTGNKTNPMGFMVADISKTSVCPLARTMRRELRNRGITHLKVVYSREEPKRPSQIEYTPNGKAVPASNPFVPPAAGLLIAQTVVTDLIGYGNAIGYSPN